MKKQRRKCGKCGDYGHNARTCKSDEAQEQIEISYNPLLPHQIRPDGTYWSAYGDSGWSAVIVRKVRVKKARVVRVNPKTEAISSTSKTSLVKLTELVRRNPDLNGADKPVKAPSEVFAEVRRIMARENERRQEPTDVTLSQEPTDVTSSNDVVVGGHEPITPDIAFSLLDLIDDDSTDDDW